MVVGRAGQNRLPYDLPAWQTGGFAVFTQGHSAGVQENLIVGHRLVNNEAVGFIAQIDLGFSEDDNFEEGKGGGFAVERIVRERTLHAD